MSPLTTKWGPMESLLQVSISLIQRAEVRWSAVALSRTPHRISTTSKSRPLPWQYFWMSGNTSFRSWFLSLIVSKKQKDHKETQWKRKRQAWNYTQAMDVMAPIAPGLGPLKKKVAFRSTTEFCWICLPAKIPCHMYNLRLESLLFY